MPHADRTFRKFGNLLDIKTARAEQTWIRLEADGSFTERTLADMQADIGGSASFVVASGLPGSDTLIAGDFVNIWYDAGVMRVRKADAALALRAHGFVGAPTGVGDGVTVLGAGNITAFSGLVDGATYYVYTNGTVSIAPPAAGYTQPIGVATGDDTFSTNVLPPTAFVHLQGGAATTWGPIAHGLGFKPSVTVRDGADTVVAHAEHHDANSLTLHFINATLGEAHLS